MTYIVDQKLRIGDSVDENTKGNLMLGTSNTDKVYAARMFGLDHHFIHVGSDDLMDEFHTMIRWLKVIALHLSEGSDLDISEGDIGENE